MSEKDLKDCGVARETLVTLYSRMLLIRRLEEKIAELYPRQEMRCPTHLSIGQEAVAAGVCSALEKDDTVFLNHRCHAAYIAKGGDIRKVMAELYGKKTGCTKGRGGSMHLVDPDVGVIGASAILAGTIPIACGAAMSYKRKKIKRVAVCFFGDAAIEEGTFFESVNLALVWQLPVLFVCENNGLSTCTPLAKRQVPVPIHERVKAFGMPVAAVDGNDALAVYEAARDAVARARKGKGPSFIEASTYRWLEHVGPNFDWSLGYRSKEEVEDAMRRCPVKTFEERLAAAGILTGGQKTMLRDEISERVEDAARFGKESAFPDPHELLEATDG
ncbi:MAG: thiamine pyrophosphate-dependent dehydrogenase E1 component subunit alpha [Elusimicrobia bacterium]|nr:thiamine pyrophosphate-dependent dehydrogenase E1 component subunit alpha [Elusimicrobiota bacterium]